MKCEFYVLQVELGGWADLSLRCAHMSFCWFCHAAAHFINVNVEMAKGDTMKRKRENRSENE